MLSPSHPGKAYYSHRRLNAGHPHGVTGYLVWTTFTSPPGSLNSYAGASTLGVCAINRSRFRENVQYRLLRRRYETAWLPIHQDLRLAELLPDTVPMSRLTMPLNVRGRMVRSLPQRRPYCFSACSRPAHWVLPPISHLPTLLRLAPCLVTQRTPERPRLKLR